MPSSRTPANSIRSTKVVFLDIDGVFNSHDWYSRRTSQVRHIDELDPDAVARFDRFITKADAAIVISSTWRISFTITQLQLMLESKGLKNPYRIIGTTTSLNGDKCRGQEIDLWLRNAPPIKSFVIIDDDSDMEPHMDRLVKTSFDFGFLEEHGKQALKLLGVK